MEIRFTVKGLTELTRGLDKFPKNLEDEFKVAMQKSIFAIEAKAKPITPHDRGHLLQNIYADYIKPFESALGAHAPYAIFVHEGTKKWPLSMPPRKPDKVRQFLKEGLERSQDSIDVVFKSAVDKALMKSI